MFFSGILMRDGRVLWQEDLDEHVDLIKYYGVGDILPTEIKTFEPFIIFPKDGNVFNKDMDNWIFSIVNEFAYAKISSTLLPLIDIKRIPNELPEWVTEDMVQECFSAFKSVLNRRVITSGCLEIDDGRWFIGGNTIVRSIGGKAMVERLAGKANVWHIGNQATVRVIEGDVTVWSTRGNCSIGTIKDNVHILTIGDKTKVWEIKGGCVDNIGDSAEIGCISGKETKVRSIGDKVKVRLLRDGCTVDYVGGIAEIDEVLQGATIHTLRNKAVVRKLGGFAGIEFMEQQCTVMEAYIGCRIGVVRDRAVVRHLEDKKSVWQVGESKIEVKKP